MESDGRLARIADSLYPAGDTYEELADSYEEALRRADLCGLHFKPGKVIICPREAVLFGWKLTGTEWKPTTHTTSALVVAKPPSTVNGLRSFLGSFKQFAECVPKYAVVLHELEQLVGGRASAERIQWTDDNLRKFEQAKLAAADVSGVHVPKPDDQLHTYSDYSEDGRAVGGRLEIIRIIDGQEVKLLGGYFSVILDKFKQHWAPCEAEAAGVRLVLHHFEPFIRENQNITVPPGTVHLSPRNDKLALQDIPYEDYLYHFLLELREKYKVSGVACEFVAQEMKKIHDFCQFRY